MRGNVVAEERSEDRDPNHYLELTREGSLNPIRPDGRLDEL
jgi:hypothetical protein